MADLNRRWLDRLVRYCAWIMALAIVFVLLDFMIDVRPASVYSSYQFKLPDLAEDQARILRQDNLSIVVIRRSRATIRSLTDAIAGLQDPESRSSMQPGFARNPLRSRDPEYFVAYAIGTDLGCPLEVEKRELLEVCGVARYDFAGRALVGEKAFKNLPIPNYDFSADFATLTIKP